MPLIQSRTRTIIAINFRAVAALITVNVVSFMYVYDAFHENLEEDKEKEE